MIFAFPASPSDGIETRTSAINKAYANLNSFTATFTQTLTNATAKTSETRTGTIHFKKPLLVRWESKGDSQELLIVTKKEVWDYFPDEEIAYRHPLSFAKDARTVIGIITGQTTIESNFTVSSADASYQTLHLYPKDPTPQMTEVTIHIDPKTNLIRTVEITDFYNNTNKIEFDKMDTGVNLKDSIFAFTPPKGIKVQNPK